MTSKKQTQAQPVDSSTEAAAKPPKQASSEQDSQGVTTLETGVSPPGRPGGKLGIIADILKRPEGATLEQLMDATAWQAHSIRGAMSGSLTKKHGITIVSEKTDAGRVYYVRSEAGQ